MSNVAKSNLTSRQYCPECGSFSIKRLRRGFISKVVLKLSAQYQCAECGEQSSKTVLDENELKRMPVFINSG